MCATKKQTGKVVPTWNYAVVRAYGSMRAIDDAVWLRAQLETLTAHNEAAFAEPWAVADAPSEFTESLIRHIVNIEMVVTRLIGKWKVSQNQPSENRASVIAGLKESGLAESSAMAGLVEGADKKTQ